MTQTFTLTITMGNDAMQSPRDIAAALQDLAARLEDAGEPLDPIYSPHGATIRDENGNTVGSWEITDPAQGPDCTVDCAEYGCAGEGGWTHATKEGD